MDQPFDNSLVFSSKKRVFRVLSIEESGLSHPTTPASMRDAVPFEHGSDSWLSAAVENAVAVWAAAQSEPDPGRVEAIRRLLETALGNAP